jgi:hypothetical protein
MPTAPTHLHDDSAPCPNRSGYAVLGEAMVDLCKVGGAATYGSILGGDLGMAIGGVLGGSSSSASTCPNRRVAPDGQTCRSDCEY